MKNLFIISAVLIFAVFGCGDPQKIEPNPPYYPPGYGACVELSGGEESSVIGTWKEDADSTIFTIATDTKGYGDGICTGNVLCDNPCYFNDGCPGAEVRWSVSGNIITFYDGSWYTDDDGKLKYYVYGKYIFYWEIKPDSVNTMTLEYLNKQYNKCYEPFNSTRQ